MTGATILPTIWNPSAPVVNEQGAVIEARDHYPYGLMMPGRTFTAGQETREGFTGYELDQETSFYYAGARYYMPALGRFTSTDRFAHLYSFLSPYQYAANNPVYFIDVNGDTLSVVGSSSEQTAISRELNRARSSISGNEVIGPLDSMPENIVISPGSLPGNKGGRTHGVTVSKVTGEITGGTPRVTLDLDKINDNPKTTLIEVLAHELQHVSDLFVPELVQQHVTELGVGVPDKDQNLEKRARNTSDQVKNELSVIEAKTPYMPPVMLGNK